MNGTSYAAPTRRLEQLLRLKSFPVAMRLLADEADLAAIPFVRRVREPLTLCQLVNLVRNFDWTVGATAADFHSPVCPSIIGLCDTPPLMKDGTFRSIVWVRNRNEGKKFEESILRLPLGKHRAVALAPLAYDPFEPDIVLVYANPAQIMILINALQFEDYEPMNLSVVGESSCSDVIARCYLTNKPAVSIPCYGERRYGHAQDDEMVMALPIGHLDKAVRGLETLYRRGVRYPISYAGAELNLDKAFPPAYGQLAYLEQVRGADGRLLVGLTGGIASGKTAVARMLEEKGAAIIDFDVLAREVVEPGQPAYQDIVEFFGREILAPDGTIDRRRLSDRVFADIELRKKLESFTHPRIHQGFLRRLEAITRQNPRAVIVAVIPLLLEVNLQHLFHKLLLVHVPPEVQAARLMAREGIDEEEARRRLAAQMPIDQKIGYVDDVIDNRGSLKDTRRQVDAWWDAARAEREA